MSATCDAIAPELVAYLDGALADDQRRPIATHVSTCLVCRREMERLTTVQRWVADLPRVEPSRDFAATFWERMEAEPLATDRPSRPVRPLRWAVPALAAFGLRIRPGHPRAGGGGAGGGEVAVTGRRPAAAVGRGRSAGAAA